jgi:hypothetical protein
MPTFIVADSEPRHISVYSEDLIDDVVGSANESGSEMEELEIHDEQRLSGHQRYLAENLPGWILSPQSRFDISGRQVQLVTNPTLSKISHRCLHPALYTDNVHPVTTLEEMARLLGTDPSWEIVYNKYVEGNIHVMNSFRQLRALGNSEVTIRLRFAHLVTVMSVYLNINLTPIGERIAVVGGMLVRPKFDISGRIDPSFHNANNQPVLGSEIKTESTFPAGAFWHRAQRASQTFAALYSLGSPIVLFTPQHFKFFFENEERDRVYTFPADQDPEASRFLNASLMGAMGRDFLKAITITLLSSRALCADEHVKPDVEASSSVKTPNSRKPLRTPENSAEKASTSTGAQRVSQTRAHPSAKARAPKFVSGYHEGKPVYTEIRVAAPGENAVDERGAGAQGGCCYDTSR